MEPKVRKSGRIVHTALLAGVISVSLCLRREATIRTSNSQTPKSSCPETTTSTTCFWKQCVVQEEGVCLYSYSLIMFELREEHVWIISPDRETSDN